MSDSQDAMARAIAKRDKAAKQLDKAKGRQAEALEKVKQIKADAEAHGVDLSKLPTKAETKADKTLTKKAQEAAAAEDAREAAEAERRTKSTAQRMAERVVAGRAEVAAEVNTNPVSMPPMWRGPLRSADRIALMLGNDGVLGQQADPSRNALPTERFLRPTTEVVAQTQPQRGPVMSQRRVAIPQSQRPRTLDQMVRPWGAAPGQETGVNVDRVLAARAAGIAR